MARGTDPTSNRGATDSGMSTPSATGVRASGPAPAAPLSRFRLAAVEGVEQAAARVLASVPEWVWDGESLPVPVEDIADTHFGLLIRDVDDLARAPGAPPTDDGRGLSGLLLADRGEIWVSAEEARQWPPRRRFTICHELGHWCLHRDGGARIFCRHGVVTEQAPADRSALPPREEEANAFGAALLMPAHLLREHYARPDFDFQRACWLFGASGAAMGRRLHAVI